MNTEHLQQCADAGASEARKCAAYMSVSSISSAYIQDNDARLAFARAAISTYLKLNPVWVRASERMPTPEDADKNERVAAWSKADGFYSHNISFIEADPAILWTSIKHLPPPPDPFEDWLASQPDDVRAADKELVKRIYNSIKQ